MPTNFSTYKLDLPVNQFSSQSDFRNRKNVYEVVLDGIVIDGAPYYQREAVVNLPPISLADIRGLTAILANFPAWQNDKTGVYAKISRILSLVVPQWNMKTYSLSVWGGMTALSPDIANYHRNLDILQDINDSPILSIGNVTNPLQEIVYFKSSSDEELSVKHLMLLWRTQSKLVKSDKDGEDDIVTSINYPGIISRLPVRDTKGNFQSNPRFLLGRDGTLEPVVSETDAITLGYRYHQGQLLEKFEILKERDDIVRVQIQAFEEYFSRFARWYLSLEDIVNSPVFSSNTILNRES
jgi:hypothetical protein